MPAEWDRHEGTWLTWPTNKITWPGKMLKQVESIYLQMISALLTGEKVHLLVPDTAAANRVLSGLRQSRSETSRLVFHKVKAVDTWIRDYGPIFVKRKQKLRSSKGDLAFTKWTFNAWGGKYKDLAKDNGVVDKLPYLKSFKRETIPMVLEGGSIDTNGRGFILTTEQCLLNPNRNPQLSKDEIESKIKKHLGAEHVIWLGKGIEGDDTDGHIDDITRFVAPWKVLTCLEENGKDENCRPLETNFTKLDKIKHPETKRKLTVGILPMPGVVKLDEERGRLPASYANFYIGNRVVLAPVYSHANDSKAVKILQQCFPDRRVVPIECTPLVYGLGSIHCVTQQQPA